MGKRIVILLAFLLLLALPLAGGVGRGLPPGFRSFPPLVTHPPVHAAFSGPVFTVFAALGLFAAGVLLIGFRPPQPDSRSPRACPAGESSLLQPGSRPPRACPVGESGLPPSRPRFPLHGILGLALLLAAWGCAWGRFALPPAIRDHAFFPLWVGFIFFLDGLVFRRQGRSTFADRRAAFLASFPVSALSWWYFEYLNRFVQNWWYVIPMRFGPAHYVVYSTLCFSTVIPAIFEIRDFLASFPALRHRWSRGPRVRLPRAAAAFFALGVVVLPLVPLFPDPLFFAVWVAPLALLAGALGLAREKTPFDPLRDGDWSPAILLALAALICGFFWELWNAGSSPRWAYAVPYVDRFHLFAMPAVGYAGYLPFGPVCACFWFAWTQLLPERIRKPVADSLPPVP